jgi:hypothetical protein
MAFYLFHLSASHDDLNAVLIAVRNDVMTTTQDAQVPWEHSALRGRLYFNQAASTSEPGKGLPTRLSEAAEAWRAAERTTSVPALEAFVSRYEETYFAVLARARIEELGKQKLATTKPEPVEETGSTSKSRLTMLQQGEERGDAQPKADKNRAIAPAAVRSGSVFRDSPECPEMVVVPA